MSFTIPISDPITPEAGWHLHPDGWQCSEVLLPGNTAEDGDFILSDGSRVKTNWPGCDFYLSTGKDFGITKLAINLRISGRTVHIVDGQYRKVRVEIT